MGSRSVSLFFLSFFTLYGCANLYLWTWMLRVLPPSALRRALSLGLLFLALAYPAGRFGSRRYGGFLWESLHDLGSLFLAFLATAVAVGLLVEAGRLILRLGGIRFTPKAAKAVFFTVLALIGAVTAGGALAARLPRVRVIDLELPRLDGQGHEMTVAFASDLHAGSAIHNARLRSMVELIGNLKADLILLGGDLVDRSVTEAIEEDLAGELSRLDPPLGLFAVAGNHEYYARLEPTVAHIEEGEAKVLLDEAVTVADTILLVGRHDVQAPRFGYRRASLDELLQGRTEELPVIVVDHTPRDIDEAAAAGIALQLSGHTHRGQIWPFHLVTGRLFDVDYGLARIGGTWGYVSNGLGTWGPPVRTTGRPEVVLFRLTFR
jgi:hypothetical protein